MTSIVSFPAGQIPRRLQRVDFFADRPFDLRYVEYPVACHGDALFLSHFSSRTGTKVVLVVPEARFASLKK